MDGKFKNDNNNTWYLLQTGKIKTDDPDAPSHLQMKENDYGNEQKLKLQGVQSEVVWDKDDKKEAGFIEFYKKHPSARNKYKESDVLAINPNADIGGESELPDVSPAPQEFEIIDHELENLIGYYKADVEWEVMDAIRYMGWPEIYNNAYRMGVANPHERDAREVFNEVRNQALQNGVEFLRGLRESGEVDIIVNKAISYGIIQWDGDSYKYGNQVVGVNAEQVIHNFKHDEGMYQKSVKPEVINKDRVIFETESPEESYRLKREPKKEKKQPEPEPEAETETETENKQAEQSEQEQPKQSNNQNKKNSGNKNKGKGNPLK